MSVPTDPLRIAGREFGSRLILGTGGARPVGPASGPGDAPLAGLDPEPFAAQRFGALAAVGSPA